MNHLTGVICCSILKLQDEVLNGLAELRDEHYLGTTFGALMKEVRYLDYRFRRVSFNDTNAPVRDWAFKQVQSSYRQGLTLKILNTSTQEICDS